MASQALGPEPRTRAPVFLQGVSSRALRSNPANPGAGKTLCTRRRRGEATRRTAPAERLGSGGGGERGVFLAPPSPNAASWRDRERRRVERAVPDGSPGPSTRAGPAWRRAAARAPLRGQPPCRPSAAASAPASSPNFSGENRSCPSCRGATLSPGPRNCSPPRLRSQDPLKIWRPRTSFLGPLRESRNASLQDPGLPVGAKFQLVGPRKGKAPLVQCDTDSKFSGTESKSCSRSPPGAARVLQPQQFAGGEIAK